MATTALIVEMIIVGVFGLVWMGMLVFKLFNLDVSLIPDYLLLYKDWSTAVVLISIIVAYQLGWSLNQFSYFLGKRTFYNPVRLKVFKEDYKNFETIKATVLMQGSSYAIEKVKERLSAVRLTRSGAVNFFLISIGLFTYGQWLMGIIMAIVTIVFLLQAVDMYSTYCHQIFNSYKVINLEKKKRKTA